MEVLTWHSRAYVQRVACGTTTRTPKRSTCMLPVPVPPLPQGLAAIGTLLEITEHSNLEDGRILVNNVGRQRFKIVEVGVGMGWVVVVVRVVGGWPWVVA